jgi:hypothetical protein
MPIPDTVGAFAIVSSNELIIGPGGVLHHRCAGAAPAA